MNWYTPLYPLPETVRNLKINDILVDITLIFGNKKIKAHKIVLMLYLKSLKNIESVSEYHLNPPDDEMLESYINILYHQDLTDAVKKYENWRFDLLMLETLKYLGVENVDYKDIINEVEVNEENFGFFVDKVFKILENQAPLVILRLLDPQYNLSTLIPYKEQMLNLLKIPTFIYVTIDNEIICENIDNDIIFHFYEEEENYLIDIVTDKIGKYFAYYTEAYKTYLQIFNFNGIEYKTLTSNKPIEFAVFSPTSKYVCLSNGIYKLDGEKIYNNDHISTAVFSWDEKYLFFVEYMTALKFLDIENKKIIYKYQTTPINLLDLSINNLLLVVKNENIEVIDTISNKRKILNIENVHTAVWSPINNHILIGTNKNIILYNYDEEYIVKTFDFVAQKILWSDNYDYVIFVLEGRNLIFNITNEDLVLENDYYIITWFSRKYLIKSINK